MNLIACVVFVDPLGRMDRAGPILLFPKDKTWVSEDGSITVDGPGLFNETAAGWRRGLNKMMMPMTTNARRVFVCSTEGEYHAFMTGYQIGTYSLGLALENQKRILPYAKRSVTHGQITQKIAGT